MRARSTAAMAAVMVAAGALTIGPSLAVHRALVDAGQAVAAPPSTVRPVEQTPRTVTPVGVPDPAPQLHTIDTRDICGSVVEQMRGWMDSVTPGVAVDCVAEAEWPDEYGDADGLSWSGARRIALRAAPDTPGVRPLPPRVRAERLRRVLAHEVGHQIDHDRLTPADRAELASRMGRSDWDAMDRPWWDRPAERWADAVVALATTDDPTPSGSRVGHITHHDVIDRLRQ